MLQLLKIIQTVDGTYTAEEKAAQIDKKWAPLCSVFRIGSKSFTLYITVRCMVYFGTHGVVFSILVPESLHFSTFPALTQ